MNKSLSVIIPCFNEEGNIRATVYDLVEALAGLIEDYELIIFDDCSTDETKKAIGELAAKNPKIRAIYNETNRGLGYSYRKGVELASKEYVIMVPGDNEVLATSVREIVRHIGKADIIIPYIENYHVRPLMRQALSRIFTITMNTISRQKIHYYNGPVLHKKSVLMKANLNNDGFAYQAEILTNLIRMGHTFHQAPMLLQVRSYGSSRAFSKKNIVSVVKTLGKLARK
jgi:dolichol-phosphate mannosyltransferase